MVKEVHHHASVGIVQSGDEFLFSQYDNGYPYEVFRGWINLIGGNQKSQDNSPWDIYEREVSDEFSGRRLDEDMEFEESLTSTIKGDIDFTPTQIDSFAPQEVIRLLMESILSNANPYADFLVKIPSFEKVNAHEGLISIYLANIPQSVLELTRENIEAGKSLVNEGLVRITSADELESGNVKAAWGTGVIMSHYLETEIPNPYSMVIEPLGKPRASFEDYMDEFEYTILQ